MLYDESSMQFSLHKTKIWLDKHGDTLVMGGIIAYTLVFSAICAWKYSIFAYNAIDLAYFNQVFWNTLHGQFFAQTLHPHPSLGDHAEIMILFLTPFYALFPDPRGLLTLQSAALALPAWPIYQIAKIRLGSMRYPAIRTVLPIMFAGAWLASPMVQNMNLFEFHMLPFALLPLFIAMLAYEKNNKLIFLGAIAAAMLVREDVALVVFAMGALAWIEKKPLWWRWVPPILSAAWFAFAMKLISHYSEGGYKFMIYYSWLGNSFGQIAVNALTKPLLVLSHVMTVANLEMILGFGLPLMFFPFIRPKRLILAALPFLQIILGAPGGGELILQTHYSTLFLPAIFLAGIEGAHEFPKLAGRIPTLRAVEKRRLLISILAVTILYSMLILGPLPSAAGRVVFAQDEGCRAEIADSMIENVSSSDSVAASYALLPHLSGRPELYSLHYHFLGVTQFSARPYEIPDGTDLVAFDSRDLLFYQTQFPNTNWTAARHEGGYGRLVEIAGTAGFSAGHFALFETEDGKNVALPKSGPNTWPRGYFTGELAADRFRTHPVLRIEADWDSPLPTGSDLAMTIRLLDSDHKTALQQTYPLPATVTDDLQHSAISIPLCSIAPGRYTPHIEIHTQNAVLHLDGIRSTKREILEQETVQEQALTDINVQ